MPDHPGHEGEKKQFGQQQHRQVAGGQAQGAQGAEDRAALLEGEADRGMDDEQPHREGEETEGRQVQMEAVRQPGDVVVRAWFYDLKPGAEAGRGGGCRGRAGGG